MNRAISLLYSQWVSHILFRCILLLRTLSLARLSICELIVLRIWIQHSWGIDWFHFFSLLSTVLYVTLLQFLAPHCGLIELGTVAWPWFWKNSSSATCLQSPCTHWKQNSLEIPKVLWSSEDSLSKRNIWQKTFKKYLNKRGLCYECVIGLQSVEVHFKRVDCIVSCQTAL